MGKKIFFASDFHLGINAQLTSLEREKKLIAWLRFVSAEAEAICLVGDVFDYWFEYRSVVPKGYVRLLGTLAELCDQGLPIHFFKGNHDMWMTDYLQREVGLTIHDHEWLNTWFGATFYIHHGDGLGPGNRKYNAYKKLMRSRYASILYSMIHPRVGLGIMRRVSKMSRQHDQDDPKLVNSQAISHCEKHLSQHPVDYYVMGHSHSPIIHPLSNEKSYYINLGDWVTQFRYGIWDGQNFRLARYE